MPETIFKANMQGLNYRNFKISLAISFAIAVILFAVSAFMGKNNFFLLLNCNLGLIADYFFAVFTNTGDSLMWILVVILLFYFKRIRLLPLMILSFVFVTIFTQVCKYYIFPGEPRPWTAIPDHSLIHHVSFIKPWLNASFPSGHTATAFTFYLLVCLISKKSVSLWLGLMYALLVGYSRIYLAQHFPFDVAGGISAAIAAVSLSVLIINWWDKRKAKNL